jgi:Domain of unknown function (DUF3463)
LLDKTDWSQYGRASGKPECADCMVHCGYEPTAVEDAMNPQNFTRSLGAVFSLSR